MTRISRTAFLTTALLIAATIATADTYKNKKTGEQFYGFRTQKKTANKTMVYSDSEKKLIPIDLSEYEYTLDEKGRRNSVVVIPITAPEILLSKSVAAIVSKSIVDASDKGPRYIILQIDNPGGRGDLMKEICTTITQTDNCPIAAYISGGTFGGAHAAAAIVALSAPKVFIAPSATLSAVGPVVATVFSQNDSDFVAYFSPDSLANFSSYAAIVADQHNRSQILLKAFIDKRLSLIEVVDNDGKSSVILKDLRQPNQTITKTLCEGFNPAPAASADTKDNIYQNIHSQILTLTPKDTIAMKLADEQAKSIQDVLSLLNVSGASIANIQGLDKAISQFAAARRNVGQSLSRISFLEKRSSSLEEQLDEIEKSRTAPTTRSKSTSNQGGRRNVVFPRNDFYYDNAQTPTDEPVNTTSRDRRNINPIYNNNNRPNQTTRETVTSTEPSMNADQVKNELAFVLTELTGEYRRVITQAKKWDGVLPPNLSLQTIEQYTNSAMVLYDSLYYRSY